jgi:hypothetical protein
MQEDEDEVEEKKQSLDPSLLMCDEVDRRTSFK